MSHLDEFETEFTNKDMLIKALTRVGFTRDQIEVHDRAQVIVGYHGTEDGKVGHVIIRKKYSGIPSDIGWEFKNGKCISHVDDFDYRSWASNGKSNGKALYDKAWTVGLLNYYNLETSKAAFESRGIQCIECKDSKGRLQLKAKFSKASDNKIKIHI